MISTPKKQTRKFDTFENCEVCESEHVVPHDGCDRGVVVFDMLGHVLHMLEEELLWRQTVLHLSLLTMLADAQVVYLKQNQQTICHYIELILKECMYMLVSLTPKPCKALN